MFLKYVDFNNEEGTELYTHEIKKGGGAMKY
jgi:hypothetical protein